VPAAALDPVAVEVGPIDAELAAIGVPRRAAHEDDEGPLPLALPVIVPTFEASPAAPRAAPALAAELADAQRALAQRKEREAAADEARSLRFRSEKEAAAVARVQRRIARQVEDARVEPPRAEAPLGSWGVAGVGLAAASDRGASPMAEIAGGGQRARLLFGGSLAATLPTALVGFGDGRTTHAVNGLAMLGVEPVRFGAVSLGVGAARRWFAEDGATAGAVWLPQVGASIEAHSTVRRSVDLRARVGGRYDLARVRMESGGATLGTLSPLELTLAVGVGR
jgi:hypothetical protein